MGDRQVVKVSDHDCLPGEGPLGHLDDVVLLDHGGIRQRTRPQRDRGVAEIGGPGITVELCLPYGGRRYGRASTPKVVFKNSSLREICWATRLTGSFVRFGCDQVWLPS